MQLIPIADSNSDRGIDAGGGSESALSGLIASIGSDGFGPEGLAQLNRWMPLCWWAVYRLFEDAAPQLHALGCFNVPDGTRRAWQVYRESLYRFDETFHAARDHLADHSLAMTHCHASEIPGRHRAEIYSRHGLSERLSVVTRRSGEGLLAVNLFRHESQAAFRDGEIDAVRRFSEPLLACVERHVSLHRQSPAATALFAQLTPRERSVCERLLKGWTHDGIAADLGVAPATVKTYRDRAFDRLGIHHRNELFALALSDLQESMQPAVR